MDGFARRFTGHSKKEKHGSPKKEPYFYQNRNRLKGVLPSSFSLLPPLFSCCTDLGFGGSTHRPLCLGGFDSFFRFSSFDLSPSSFLSSNNSSSSSSTHPLFLSSLGSFEGRRHATPVTTKNSGEFSFEPIDLFFEISGVSQLFGC